MDHVRKTFGEDADLYEVLGLKDRDEAENPAKLRKAYFRQALVYHPDRTKEKDTELAKKKFQAISFAYEILKNSEKRAEYNETGHVDEGDADDDSNDGTKDWKAYFDRIFGKVTTSKIDQFALKYKCSEEEQRDVLKEYKRFKGDLVKMLEYVMLSEPLDAKRWVEDYINPAIQAGEVPDYNDKIEASTKKIDKKIEAEQAKKNNKSKKKSKKENKKPNSDEEDEDEDEEMPEEDSEATETESEDEPPPAKKKKKGNEKVAAKKGKPTKAKVAKKKAKGGKEEDLVAMIQANKAKRSGDLIANLGARYGVQMDEDDDPLDDEEFEKVQARLSKKKKAR